MNTNKYIEFVIKHQTEKGSISEFSIILLKF